MRAGWGAQSQVTEVLRCQFWSGENKRERDFLFTIKTPLLLTPTFSRSKVYFRSWFPIQKISIVVFLGKILRDILGAKVYKSIMRGIYRVSSYGDKVCQVFSAREKEAEESSLISPEKYKIFFAQKSPRTVLFGRGTPKPPPPPRPLFLEGGWDLFFS